MLGILTGSESFLLHVGKEETKQPLGKGMDFAHLVILRWFFGLFVAEHLCAITKHVCIFC